MGDQQQECSSETILAAGGLLLKELISGFDWYNSC